ncbi:MAG TPA: hypothetical protein VGE42_09860 [Candidatus Dormibacteraeota bacterium]
MTTVRIHVEGDLYAAEAAAREMGAALAILEVERPGLRVRGYLELVVPGVEVTAAEVHR